MGRTLALLAGPFAYLEGLMMFGMPATARRVAPLAIVVGVCLVALLGVTIVEPPAAVARKGYRYPKTNYPKICKKGCKQAQRTCKYCVKADMKAEGLLAIQKQQPPPKCVEAKESVKASCSDAAPACRKQAKQAFKTCKKQIKIQRKARLSECKSAKSDCKGCCKVDYTDSCQEPFKDKPGYGERYGKVCYKYRGRKRCTFYTPTCE